MSRLHREEGIIGAMMTEDEAVELQAAGGKAEFVSNDGEWLNRSGKAGWLPHWRDTYRIWTPLTPVTPPTQPKPEPVGMSAIEGMRKRAQSFLDDAEVHRTIANQYLSTAKGLENVGIMRASIDLHESAKIKEQACRDVAAAYMTAIELVEREKAQGGEGE